MQQRKTRPYNQCATIRDLLEPKVGDLKNQFLNATDAEDRERLRDQALAVARDYAQVKQRIERLESRLQEIYQDYVISGCDELLGPL